MTELEVEDELFKLRNQLRHKNLRVKKLTRSRDLWKEKAMTQTEEIKKELTALRRSEVYYSDTNKELRERNKELYAQLVKERSK